MHVQHMDADVQCMEFGPNNWPTTVYESKETTING